ncbi:MAG: hypothetical protein PHY30_01385 [Candidatus Pacebacteria bacterium]|nr:hypothetical protein [Candidatus Paceibacterota bacterium]
MNKFFKNILKNKKIIILSVLGVLCLSFLLPKIVHADAFGVMDIFSMQLDALDVLDVSVRKYSVLLTIILAETLAYLVTSAAILDWAINLPVNIIHNPLVTTGWNFISGIANLVIIISFVWTGLSIIIQGDSTKGRSTLIRLIIIAIFVNFSLFAFGGLVDLAEFLKFAIMNAFATGPEPTTLAWTAAQTLLNYTLNSLTTTLLPLVISQIFISLIPIGNVAAIVIYGVTFMTLGVTGWLPLAIFNMILNFIIGSTFFLLAAILLMRIAFLWILAMTTPLAVVLYKTELPIVNKFFGEWWKYFMDWIFAGVILIFFIGLGFKFFNLRGDNAALNVLNPFEGHTSIIAVAPDFFVNYIFLFLYMVVVCVILAKNWIPSLGQDIINQATGFATKAKKTFSPMVKRDFSKFMNQGIDRADELDAYNDKMNTINDFRERYGEENWQQGYLQETGENAPVIPEAPDSANKWFKGGVRRKMDELGRGKLSGRGLDAENADAEKVEQILKGDLSGKLYGSNDIREFLSKMKTGQLHKMFEGGNLFENEINKLIDAAKSLSKDDKERVARSMVGMHDTNPEMFNKTLSRLMGPMANIETLVKDTADNQASQFSETALRQTEVITAAFKNWNGKHFSDLIANKKKFEAVNSQIPQYVNLIEVENPRAKKYFIAKTNPYDYPVQNKEQTSEKSYSSDDIKKGINTTLKNIKETGHPVSSSQEQQQRTTEGFPDRGTGKDETPDRK